MEKPEILIFGSAEKWKIWNNFYLTKKRKEKEKAKIYILSVLRLSSEIAESK